MRQLIVLLITLTLSPFAAAQTNETPIGEIAYVHTKDGAKSQIYIINADSTDAHPLTDGSRDAFLPLWSPDGQKIAYLENTTDQPLSEQPAMSLMVVNADGTNPVEIVTAPENGFIMSLYSYFDWSPDSQRMSYIIYSEADERPYRLFVADVNGVDQVEIEMSPEASYPHFISSDELLVSALEGAFRVDLHNGEQIPMNDIPFTPLAVSPNGKQLVLTDPYSLRIMDVDGTTDHTILEPIPGWGEDDYVVFTFFLAWSPDSEYISGAVRMVHDSGSGHGSTPAEPPYGIFTVRVDGTKYTLIEADQQVLTWSPDSTYIAYHVVDDGSYQVAVARPDGSDEVILTTDDNNSQPAWRPIIE